jgi:hypothetical protein
MINQTIFELDPSGNPVGACINCMDFDILISSQVFLFTSTPFVTFILPKMVIIIASPW